MFCLWLCVRAHVHRVHLSIAILLLLLLCHMPSGTRAKLPCEANKKKEQQSQHHNTYIISTVNQSVQQQSVKPGPWKGALATRIEQSTSS